ncbi:FAD-dependent oxidoreductase [Chelatococcus reniformis]|uniref:FAD-binding protein n=1 Tax=Chelatococcus reniformis TaxID=1494448 RepID=A0A916UJF1_9HYPH|nr:FAD-binding oxidoreductase [Chelatococcus reniformis]GGC75340.1 FAD-binding protein [Chelatococcus reniformis]
MTEVDRRGFLHSATGAAFAAAAPLAVAGAAPAGEPDWELLRAAVGERLIRVDSPLARCAAAGGAGADALFARLKNPFYLGDEPALTQTLGWTGAWTSRASPYAVAARSTADVAAAVLFARRAGVRLVVKGGGHSYFGNSNAEGALLVWTRAMNAIEPHEAFVAEGAPPATARPAVSVGAGALWGETYRAVSVEGGRYVQGGGCLTVGVAGFVLGGGFGSLSKGYGTGAASLLEAEVVTADGQARIVNPWREPELFFALRGGGGGTFGIATRLTLATHPLPATIGAVQVVIAARSDTAWAALVARIVEFYAAALFNPDWGEQISFGPGRRLTVAMVFRGLDEGAARALWQPFLASLAAHPDYEIVGDPFIVAIPAHRFWDPALLRSVPGVVLADNRPAAAADNIFWASNLGEAGQVLQAYQSAWLPARLLAQESRSGLADALVAASGHWKVTLHTNKGLAGGAAEALAATRETATNPQVNEAFALAIVAAVAPPAWPGIPGHEPDPTAARRNAGAVARAMAPLRQLTPQAGTYVSESDFFQPDWQRAYWGSHYRRLAAAKRRYDPDNIFRGHYCVEPG